jgi:hypothetical protein
MLHGSKAIWNDDASLIDLSQKLSDFYNDPVVLDIVADDDKLYLGADYAFNHRFIDIRRPNSDAATISAIETWNGSSWDAVAQIIDDTQDSAGATFGKSGIIGWVPDRNQAWGREDTTEDIAELSTLKIYDKYWIRLTFDADFTATTEINYVGHRFSRDDDLRARYPDLLNPEALNAFEQGKTNWNAQHILAAEELIRDMKRDLDIWTVDQILDWQLFTDASVHKVASMIFAAFGRDYIDNKNQADKDYAIARNKKIFNTDKNNNAILRPAEKIAQVGFRRV